MHFFGDNCTVVRLQISPLLLAKLIDGMSVNLKNILETVVLSSLSFTNADFLYILLVYMISSNMLFVVIYGNAYD